MRCMDKTFLGKCIILNKYQSKKKYWDINILVVRSHVFTLLYHKPYDVFSRANVETQFRISLLAGSHQVVNRHVFVSSFFFICLVPCCHLTSPPHAWTAEGQTALRMNSQRLTLSLTTPGEQVSSSFDSRTICARNACRIATQNLARGAAGLSFSHISV